jgi:hypothetical protein|tara:strand:+ start:2134 stop:2403 length:270 start_codon:yes stop_codon:yes gene_type:complete
MKYVIIRNFSCTDPKRCFESMMQKIEKESACTLHASATIKEVHGSLSCLHEKNNHVWTVEFADKENQIDDVTIKKLDAVPTENQIQNII